MRGKSICGRGGANSLSDTVLQSLYPHLICQHESIIIKVTHTSFVL